MNPLHISNHRLLRLIFLPVIHKSKGILNTTSLQGKMAMAMKCMLITIILYAQFPLHGFADPAWQVQQSIKGQVVDDHGVPIAGATIEVKPYALTTSNQEGHFTLLIPINAKGTLVVTSLGYTPYSTPLPLQDPLQIVLKATSTQLEEVIVVGYGTQQKKEFTGASVRIEGQSVQDAPVQSFDQALSGKAAGVRVGLANGQLNSAPVIRIRGVNSISLSSYPLVVIDGIPVSTGDISSNRAANNPLADLNPNDIATIDVLKDAASTSIYGSRAAGGVLLITTKKGKAGDTRTSYHTWISTSQVTRLPKMLGAQAYTDIKNEAIRNATAIDGVARPDVYFTDQDENGQLVDTDWKPYVYRKGFSHQHALSIQGGTDKTRYYLSANLGQQEGILVGNDFDRKGLRFSLDHQINTWLNITGGGQYSSSSNASYDSGSLPGASMTTTGAARLALVLPPNVSALTADGKYNINPNSGTLNSGNNKTTIPLYNPLSLFALSSNISQNNHLLGNLSAQLQPLPGLTVVASYALDRIDLQDKAYRSPELGSEAFTTGGSVSNISTVRSNEAWTTTAQYQQNKHNYQWSVLAGYDLQKSQLNAWGARGTQASDNFFEYYQGGWANIIATGNALGERIFASVFGRGTLSYRDRYYLTANYRRDGNSALAVGRKYGNFGGVSAGWAISEESFYQSSSLAQWLNTLRLNASWGKVGNGNLANDFSSYDLYQAGLYGSAATWAIAQQGNPDLTWETSNQTNIGLSAGLWNNRLQIEAAYYRNHVDQLILSTPQSPSKGIPNHAILANVGSLYNEGFEFSTQGRVLQSGRFQWNSQFNIATLKNRVTALAGGNEDIIGATGSGNTNITRVGYAVGQLYGLKTVRVNPENGQRVFLNRAGEEVQFNGVGQWTYLDGRPAKALSGDDFYLLGNTLPVWHGGWNHNFQYGPFELSAQFSFAGGHYIMNRTRSSLTDQIFFNNSVEILDRWTSPGQITHVPRVVAGDRISFGGSTPISEHVEKGDFLRLQQLQLRYTFPSQWIQSASLHSLSLYAQAQNAWLWTKYSGADPEISANGHSNIAPGVEYNTAGPGRTWALGLQLTL
jgi:TonB-linked SusC/RagA family outer membrane protein